MPLKSQSLQDFLAVVRMVQDKEEGFHLTKGIPKITTFNPHTELQRTISKIPRIPYSIPQVKAGEMEEMRELPVTSTVTTWSSQYIYYYTYS